MGSVYPYMSLGHAILFTLTTIFSEDFERIDRCTPLPCIDMMVWTSLRNHLRLPCIRSERESLHLISTYDLSEAGKQCDVHDRGKADGL